MQHSAAQPRPRWALEETLAWVERTGGRLNFNDAFIVALQANGLIGELASFDVGFDEVEGLRRHHRTVARPTASNRQSRLAADPQRVRSPG